MSSEKTRVLVVDDQRSMRLTLAGIIEDQGHEVIEVEDGYQAIAATSRTHFDLVFMDIKMPGINGVQAFREIKKTSPGTVVVMMTGFAVEDLVEEALTEGAFAVVYKPFEIDHVIGLMESVLKTVVILVVDDRASDREILGQILTDKGFNVATAADGDEAIQMVKSNHHDIIFMDVKMPGKDGFTTFEVIRSIDPEARVIFMTGFVDEEPIRQAIDSGAYPIAYKPFDMTDILKLVRKTVTETPG